VGAAGAPPSAAQSFVVVVDENKTDEPLVVASTPGEASEILQGLTRPEPEETEVAAVEEPAAPEPEAEPEAEPEETEVAAVEPQPETPELPVPAVQPTIDAIEIEGTRNFFAGAGQDGSVVRLYVDDVFVADATVGAGRWLIEAENVLTSPSQRVRVDQLAPGSADVAARAEVNFVVDIPDVDVAQVEPPVEDHTTPAVAEPTAGETPPPVPTENAPTADPAAAAEVAGAAEPSTAPGPAGETAPADAIEPVVAGTAPAPTEGETPTRQMDLPATEEPTAEPEERDTAATPEAEPTNPPVPEVSAQSEPETTDRPAETPAVESPATPTGDTDAGSERVTEPAPTETESGTRPSAETDASPEQGAAETPSTEAEPAVEPEPQVEAQPEAPAAEPEPAPAAEPAAAPEATETADAEIPTMVAQPVGDPAMQRFASGRAIIRRGDNLWTIATRVYGEGMRYTMIWNANTEQIRDPHWIYPGQVFELPTNP
jgi:nucleoid-associated protein YgaU